MNIVRNAEEAVSFIRSGMNIFVHGCAATPVPLLNYVAHVRLFPVTDGDQTFWQWESRFDTPAGRERELHDMVSEQIYQAGFDAIRGELGLMAVGAS